LVVVVGALREEFGRDDAFIWISFRGMKGGEGKGGEGKGGRGKGEG
jgi:hypothetical protein